MNLQSKAKKISSRRKGSISRCQLGSGVTYPIVDIETGGFNSQTDAILELGAVIPSMDESGKLVVDQTFFQRIVPFEGSNLEESALKFTGIDPNHPLRIAQPERDVFTNFFDIVRAAMKANGCNRACLLYTSDAADE